MKPVTIVDIAEPLQDGDCYSVTVEVPDEPQAAIAWPRFCAKCMRAAVVGSELSRVSYYKPFGGQGRMVRRIITRVPYCGEHQTGPSRKDRGFYLKLLVAGFLGLMTGILLAFLGRGWPDLQMYGWLVFFVSTAAILFGGFSFAKKLINPDAVGLELDPKGLEVVFNFFNVDYGRKFVEANPSRGEVVLSRQDHSIMITGSKQQEILNREGGAGQAPNIQPMDERESNAEAMVSREDEFEEHTSPSIQPLPSESGSVDELPASGVGEGSMVDDSSYYDGEDLGVEDMDALGFEEDEIGGGSFSQDFAEEDAEYTVADSYGDDEDFAAPESHSESHLQYGFHRDSSFERQTTNPFDSHFSSDGADNPDAINSSMHEVELNDPPPPPDVMSKGVDSSGMQEDMPPPPPPLGSRKK